VIRLIFQSKVFRKYFIVTVIFFICFFVLNNIFDLIWKNACAFPVTNLYDVYAPPGNYDDMTKINLVLSSVNTLCIEGNKKFRFWKSEGTFSYIDSTKFVFPDETPDRINKIYLQFENNSLPDSIYLVVSKSDQKEMFWKQIFLSSVMVSEINQFSTDSNKFRIKTDNLINQKILSDNDTLIKAVLEYFNTKIDTTLIAECGTNSILLKKICDTAGLPCRIIGLQGGDVFISGFNFELGYPLHALCEVYSSRFKKWYVIDPTYGLRFREGNEPDYLNAVEISNKYFFMREGELQQDSVLFTKRSLLGRDYFKYYENIYYEREVLNSFLFTKLLSFFYKRFNYNVVQYSNNLLPLKNGLNYVAAKSLMFLFLFFMYINIVVLLLVKRLYVIKKDKILSSIKAK
jgi:hypothetical protein